MIEELIEKPVPREKKREIIIKYKYSKNPLDIKINQIAKDANDFID